MNRLFQSFSYTFIAFFISTASAQAITVQFSDQTFDDSDWTAILGCTTPGQNCSFNASQQLTGGNPDEFRSVQHDFTGAGSIGVRHFANFASYNPSAGAITSIDFSFDAAFLSSNPSSFNAVSYQFVIRQDGLVYEPFGVFSGGSVGPGLPPFSSPGEWVSYGATGATESDFVASGMPNNNPDFSSSGSIIEFGYLTSNSSGFSNSKQTVSGIDNWSVTVNAVPEPLTILGAGTAAGFGTFFKRTMNKKKKDKK